VPSTFLRPSPFLFGLLRLPLFFHLFSYWIVTHMLTCCVSFPPLIVLNTRLHLLLCHHPLSKYISIVHSCTIDGYSIKTLNFKKKQKTKNKTHKVCTVLRPGPACMQLLQCVHAKGNGGSSSTVPPKRKVPAQH